MRFVFGKQDLRTIERARESLFMLTNGLGGYVSVSAGYSVPRCDQGLLVAAVKAPNVRITMVHRMAESLVIGGKRCWLSTQEFADDTPNEDGWKVLSSCVVEATPHWTYDVRGVRVTREIGMAWEKNAVGLCYVIENRSSAACTLALTPWVLGFEKGHAPQEAWPAACADGCITTNG